MVDTTMKGGVEGREDKIPNPNVWGFIRPQFCFRFFKDSSIVLLLKYTPRSTERFVLMLNECMIGSFFLGMIGIIIIELIGLINGTVCE